MKVVVVIPTYNEKENIGRMIEALKDEFEKVKNHEMSILAVDGNSPDGTGEAVREKMKRYKNLQLLTEKKKQGLGAAYIQGFEYAIEKMGAQVVFEMDGDFSHPPKLIHKFLKQIDKGADFVIGSRYMKEGAIPADWGIHRKFLSVGGNLFSRLVLGRFNQIHDWTTGYRAIRVEVFEKLKKELTEFKGYTFQISFLYKALNQGYKVAEVPLKFIDRKYGQSKLGPEFLLNALLFVIGVRLREIAKK